MLSTLVSDGLEQGLNERNSTMLMWCTKNTGDPTTAGEVYSYFTQYFSDGYAGYYAAGTPQDHFFLCSYGTLGIINLKTGQMYVFSSNPLPTVAELLSYADQANQ